MHTQPALALVAEKLGEYFGQFGEVVECNIMRDPSTRRSRYVMRCGWGATLVHHFSSPFLSFNALDRGFGFITFKDSASVSKVLAAHAQEPIVLDDKNVRAHHAYCVTLTPFFRSTPK